MELINNLFQFAVTLLGFCLSGIWYLKDRKQTCFLLTCFYGCFALGSLYWTLYLLLFSETPRRFRKQKQIQRPVKRAKGKAAVKTGQQETGLFSIFQIPDTTQTKAQQGDSELKKIIDQLHLHCPPFVPPSAPLCPAGGCGSTEPSRTRRE